MAHWHDRRLGRLRPPFWRVLAGGAALCLHACAPGSGTAPKPFDSGDTAVADSDGDGWADDEDCAPSDVTVNPGADEVCDSATTDEDCDGVADDADPSVDPAGFAVWYGDDDGDGYGAGDPHQGCLPPVGTAAGDNDCDDAHADASPALVEVCGDRLDNDCDGTTNDCRHVGEFNLTDATAIIADSALGEGSGRAVAGIGDVDGDGVDDFVVGVDNASATWNSDEGAAYVLRGGATFPTDLPDAWAVLAGTNPIARVGWGVRAAGDLTGDALIDVIVSTVSGRLFLVTSITAGTTAIESVSIPVGDGEDYLAIITSSGPAAGDVTGDGEADLVVGGGQRGSDYGVDVIAGPIGMAAIGSADVGATLTNDLTGAICSAFDASGDLNGDGIADVACGTDDWDPIDYDEGGGFVFYGPLSGSYQASTDADAIFPGQTRADAVGRALAIAGDLDADGYDDLAVGAPHFDVTGAVYVLSGPPSGSIDLSADSAAVLTGEAYLGGCVAHAGDVDGDGHADLLVTDMQASAAQGLGWLEYGPISGHQTLSDADAIWRADGYQSAGSGCAGPGDVTGDGTPDLLLTSIDWYPVVAGFVFVLAGAGQ